MTGLALRTMRNFKHTKERREREKVETLTRFREFFARSAWGHITRFPRAWRIHYIGGKVAGRTQPDTGRLNV